MINPQILVTTVFENKNIYFSYLWRGLADFSCVKWGLAPVYKHWVGQNVCMFISHKVKDTFFIFTNNLIDLGILRCPLSPALGL